MIFFFFCVLVATWWIFEEGFSMHIHTCMNMCASLEMYISSLCCVLKKKILQNCIYLLAFWMYLSDKTAFLLAQLFLLLCRRLLLWHSIRIAYYELYGTKDTNQNALTLKETVKLLVNTISSSNVLCCKSKEYNFLLSSDAAFYLVIFIECFFFL